MKEKAGLSLSNILNEYVVNDKVNYSRLDAMNCQFPSRDECEEVKLSDVSMADNSAYVLYTQKRGFQEAMRIEVDLNLKKIRKIEFLDIRNKWKRVEA